MIHVRIAQFIFLFFLLTGSSCDTQNDVDDTFKNYFIKYYGEDGKQQSVDLIANTDGTMLLLGNSISPEDSSLVFLVKVDLEGNVIKQKKFFFTNPSDLDNNNKARRYNETAVDIEPTLDGRFIILSNVFMRKNLTTGIDEYDTRLRIIDSDGNLQDSTTKSAFWKDQVGYSVTSISTRYTTGGYMIAGNRSDTKSAPDLPPPDLSDILVVFYNEDLTDTLWTQKITNQHVGAGVKVFESDTYVPLKDSDRPFYLFGYSDVLTDEDEREYENNLWCVSLDENGITSADDYVGDQVKGEAMSETIKALGSGFISVGTQTSGSSSQKSIVLATSAVDGKGLKFTSQTVPVRESRNLEAVSITPSIVGGRYLILSNETSPTGNTNIWLSKVDIEGNVIWSASFGSITKNDFSGAVTELPDGKIVILGTIELESQNSKMAMIKLNSNGEFLN